MKQKSRAPAVSGLAPTDLKAVHSSLTFPLSRIFSHFLKTSSFLLDWLHSSIFFIYKGKGCRTDPGNYRSICIQNPFAKIYSSILTKRLSEFAENNNLFPTFQFGFRSNRSTTAAASLLHEVARSRLDNGKRTYVAYVDFSKAFDRVRRPLLFHKLQLLGIPSKFCQSLNFIFQSTKFFIKSGNFYTHHYTSNVGVPQGDPISPILFNLFIHDLPSSLSHNGVDFHGINVKYIQYADDLCVLGDSEKDLQRGLNDLLEYCNANFIEINVTKTKVQVFHRGRLPACSFILNDRPIEIVNNFVYLGFDFSTQLSFSQHVKSINSKARAKCGLLFARLPLMDLPLPLVLDLFSIFILPTYTYGLSLWLSNCSAASLQMINATFTKFLKRYLMVPSHSNNATIHFLTSTIPLSKHLQRAAPGTISSLKFPPILHGIRLSFFPDPSQEIGNEHWEQLQNIPSSFWLSRTLTSIPIYARSRRRLFREILDTDHSQICKSSTFHPHPLPSCICTYCGLNAHPYHNRFCQIIAT